MSLVVRCFLFLGVLIAVVGTAFYRVERELEVSVLSIERQPAEAVAHARRVSSFAFAWQPAHASANELLKSERAREPDSNYFRRSVRHAERAQRSLVQAWKVVGLGGFVAFVTGVLLAIGSSRRRRLWYSLLAVVGFAMFATGMGLL